MKEIGQHGGGGAGLEQTRGLEDLNRSGPETFGVSVEEPPVRAAQTEWGEGLFERRRLEERGEP